jgi:hypothetical protein
VSGTFSKNVNAPSKHTEYPKSVTAELIEIPLNSGEAPLTGKLYGGFFKIAMWNVSSAGKKSPIYTKTLCGRGAKQSSEATTRLDCAARRPASLPAMTRAAPKRFETENCR